MGFPFFGWRGRGNPPPEELLRQGAARGWVPEPDEFSISDLTDGRTEEIHVLLPFLAQLFKLMVKNAQIPASWKSAKLTPLYKKGPLVQPDSYRMLAVSGTMYRLRGRFLILSLGFTQAGALCIPCLF